LRKQFLLIRMYSLSGFPRALRAKNLNLYLRGQTSTGTTTNPVEFAIAISFVPRCRFFFPDVRKTTPTTHPTKIRSKYEGSSLLSRETFVSVVSPRYTLFWEPSPTPHPPPRLPLSESALVCIHSRRRCETEHNHCF